MIAESVLRELMSRQQLLPLRFCQSLWLIDSRAALYWPEQDCLLVGDLHFEKGSYLSQYASPVPRYDSRATLEVLKTLLATYQPKRVICLGDSFHDQGAFERLIEDDVKQLQSLIDSVSEWLWVEGNHDPDIPAAIGGKVVPHLMLTTQTGVGITCQHIPDNRDEPKIVGHYHPKGRFIAPPRRFNGKCLVTTDKLMLMPALGQYTGGLRIDDEVLTALAPKTQRQCYLLCEGRVVLLPPRS
ncbi:ligase-associated DNA damage response endonuclease PdeM [Alteromonas gilva]|uniref:Ligase-associated DNA damage response endonuclease PdeM n=1 Tax=Alteromonas gilva TaxID=2987522 RepID=A0ABT5KYP2_9ALTE|nr:ligase-associated DNA damage response endonuclease PdeM [Alteromonas gilva]MDC8829889.1 ligase-associated DNA damage response endonuclease PdeM [Alteromonas gilva]